MIANPVMAFTAAVPGWIVYGAPATLLLIALGRSLRTSRRAALVYFLLLAGWLAHVGLVRREAGLLPANLRIEPPDSFPGTALQIAEVDGRSVLQLQAPASLDWTLRGNERRLNFDYGFIPAAYERGETNGAGFTVRLRHGDRIRTVFYRLLDPQRRTEDRGVQQVSLVLPPVTPGEQLSLAIDAGPDGNASWDWLHLSRFGFQRSAPFLPEQFPSFQRVPDAVDAPAAVLFQTSDRTTFLELHAPAQLEYPLRGTERKVSFSYGFLAGAYQHGNATDGARFVVRLQPADGAPRVLLDRSLAPLDRANDRGPQSAEIALGAVRANDRLVFAIEPGAAGNNSWDWTYFSRVAVEQAP